MKAAGDTHRADIRRTWMRLWAGWLAVLTPAAIAVAPLATGHGDDCQSRQTARETVEIDEWDRARLP